MFYVLWVGLSVEGVKMFFDFDGCHVLWFFDRTQSTGDTYHGRMTEGKAHGVGVLTYADGEVYKVKVDNLDV